MGIDAIRNEIEHMRRQISRQNKDILSLRRAGVDTAASLLLLSRMQDKVDVLVAERDRLAGDERRRYACGKVINGTPASRRM
ncbi:hypothetical protein ONR75_18515 [Rhodopseudomonas sp. P2A-2r]|uniref:hypothetical protein n=1 Tax=Rhodopseudomonas sp. P2A-2r TaxID=2991972 RepID=UPI0022349F52|nr:hypothetical protein [Rhodopseudomonas sp. P2A-2r]UZE46998.1 hypothetical protein ONR75_18515 [Rhodopseudomonas sp. P2A-2r]